MFDALQVRHAFDGPERACEFLEVLEVEYLGRDKEIGLSLLVSRRVQVA